MIEIAKRNPVLIILLCSLIVLVIMQPWNLYFLNDDFEHIPNNHLIVRNNFLRPVSNFFLVWDRALFDKWATGYFLTTLVLHTSCAISIYYLCRRIFTHYALGLPSHVALLTAVIFLFYPFHAEPLFWIISRGSVIAALFTILSLYYYFRKNERFKYLMLSWIMFLVALFTYESIWTVVFFYCLISFLNAKKPLASRKEYIHAGGFVITFILYIFIRFISLDTITGGYPVIDSNMSSIILLFTNFIKLVARNFTPPFYSTVFSIIFFSLSVLVYGAAIIFGYKKNKAAGWLMIILCLGLISGVITAAPLSIDTHGNESERFIYYSSFFFCFFLAIVTTLPKRKEWQYIITGFVIVSGITGLIIYNANYRYTSTVTKTTVQFVKKYPNYKNAYFIDVPGEYKGALLFRVCLPDAIRWIAPDCKYDSVTIISKTENAGGILPYKTGEKTWEELTREKNKEAQSGVYALKDTLNRNILLNENDIVFWFTKKGLYRVNKP